MALIYVLEDDTLLGQTIKNLVISLKHGCEVFADEESFISATRNAAPDAILVDMWLETTNAVEVFSQNADLLAGIPAIMMSGGNGNTPLEKVTAIADIEGFRDVLYKPFERAELQALFDKLLNPDLT